MRRLQIQDHIETGVAQGQLLRVAGNKCNLAEVRVSACQCEVGGTDIHANNPCGLGVVREIQAVAPASATDLEDSLTAQVNSRQHMFHQVEMVSMADMSSRNPRVIETRPPETVVEKQKIGLRDGLRNRFIHSIHLTYRAKSKWLDELRNQALPKNGSWRRRHRRLSAVTNF